MNLGNFKPHITITESSLEDEEENLQGEEKTMFLQFLKKMIQWAPEDRRSAKELMEDPWLAFASW
jgi:serine/threonine-protein kinase SRPK3